MVAKTDKINLSFDYDRERDVLYAFKGKPQQAISEETPNGVLIRRAINTKEIVGFTIYNYSRKKKRGLLGEIPHFPHIKLP